MNPEDRSSIEQIRTPKSRAGSDNGGNRHNRDLEIERRLATIEEAIKHTATKAWVLGGVVGGCVLAVSIALAVLKWFG